MFAAFYEYANKTKQVSASQQLSLLPATTTIESTITAATHLRNEKINLTEKVQRVDSARRTKAE